MTDIRESVPSSRLDRRRRPTVSILIVALLIATIAIQVGGHFYTGSQDDALQALRAETRQLRSLQHSLFEAESSVGDFLRSGDEEQLERYFYAIQRARGTALALLHQRPTAEGQASTAGGSPNPAVVIPPRQIASLITNWSGAVRLKRQGRDDEAEQALQADAHRRLLEAHSTIDAYLARKDHEANNLEERDVLGGRVALALQLFGGLLTLAVLILGLRSGAAEARARKAAVVQAVTAHDEAVAAHGQVERLFRMTDMLQSASGHADANAVLKATADGLLPDLGCSLYVFNNSRDRLDLSSAWNLPDGLVLPETIAPHSCWALKRGKPHLNSDAGGSLACEHESNEGVALEIPMMAKGEVYGLLTFFATGPGAEARIAEVTGITMALADAMSLALANIALREKLRNQALRDPLTGLYNRRYLEDMIERFVRLSERSSTPLSVIMIDLDHFKRLNDSHGHAMGDAVLRDCAEAILGSLRQSDVACRYGGEELTVLLPDSGLEDAIAKAEVLRARIEALSEIHGTRITASMGVASFPDTSTNVGGLVAMADAALYEAKQAGRNRVVAAGGRGNAGARFGKASLVEAAE